MKKLLSTILLLVYVNFLLISCSKDDKVSDIDTIEVKYKFSSSQMQDTYIGYRKIGDKEYTEEPYSDRMIYGISDRGRIGDVVSLYIKADPRFMNQNKMYVTIGDANMKKEVKGKQGESEIKLEYTLTQEDLEYYRWYVGNK
ncbi:MAG: hypothetical protein LBF27_25560 [Sphingobacterium sp.]|nr:hypothetical protein [Sphingobacterium sp.]